VYSQRVGAEGYVQPAGAYSTTVAAGGYGEEPEVEYAGKSWDF